MLSEQKYSLVSRSGRFYVNPKDSVALLEEGKWISARPAEFANARKIELYVDDALADSTESIFNSIFEQYTKNGGTAAPYKNISEYDGQKKLPLKVNEDTVFYKQNAATQEIEEITYAQLPSNFDCFPIINISSAWELPIKNVDTFGITFYCKELVITPSTKKKTKRTREDKGASASSFFKVAKKSS
jgi:hypothetical protein